MTKRNLPESVPEHIPPAPYAAKLLSSSFIRETLGSDKPITIHSANGIVEDLRRAKDSILRGINSKNIQGISESRTLVESHDGNYLVEEITDEKSKVLLEIEKFQYRDSKRGEIFIRAYSLNNQAIDNIRDSLSKLLVENPFKETFSLLMPGPFGLYERRVQKPNDELIEENYDKDVLKDFRTTQKEIQRENPKGRFILLSGPPGTGKTRMLRAMMSESENLKFIVVPQSEETDISNPRLISLLLDRAETARVILILEDADTLIRPRKESTTASVSSLLNLADGIIGLALDLVIIATTNADLQEIDSALLRPKRLLKRIEVGLLEPEQAALAYKKITGKTKNFGSEKVSLAEVYALADEEEETIESLRDSFGSPKKQKVL